MTITPASLTVELDSAALATVLQLGAPLEARQTFEFTIPARLTRSGRAMRLVQGDGRAVGSPEPQQHLARLLQRARDWWAEMQAHELTPAALARNHGVTSSYASRLIRLNFLAPDIVEAILSGNHPAALDARTLLKLHDLPLEWSGQRAALHML